jgi:hypothetical protein
VFKEQASLEAMLLAFVYVLGVVAIIMVVLGLGVLVMGLVRRKNLIHTWVQKTIAACIAGGASCSAVMDCGSGSSIKRLVYRTRSCAR